MEEKGKLPIPALPQTAYTAKHTKRKKTDEEKEEEKRKRSNMMKSRIYIGDALDRWRNLKKIVAVKSDAELAFLLLDRQAEGNQRGIPDIVDPEMRETLSFPFQKASYEEMMATSNPQKGRYSARLPDPAESSIVSGSLSDQGDDFSVADGEELNTSNSEGASPQQLDTSVHYELPLTMSSRNEVERETCAAPSGQSSENGKKTLLLGTRHCLRLKDEATTNSSENKENRDHEEDKDAEFSTSLSVGDGRYLVDLGSSSEFVVDEECILQLFKSCRECSRQCTVRKQVKGLKLVVYQSCHFCQSRCKWTNLPDDDNGDFQINGKAAAHGQAKSAMSPSSNTS